VSRRVTWDEVYERLSSAPPGRLYGIPRGGAIVAGLSGRAVDRPEDADWIVDDVIDSGATLAQIASTKPAWGLLALLHFSWRHRHFRGSSETETNW